MRKDTLSRSSCARWERNGTAGRGDVDPKRKPSSLYVAWVECVEREMLMSSKQEELPEQCLREHRGTAPMNHPTDPGR